VVFDEAHNIDNVCIEALSINLREATLAAASRNLSSLQAAIQRTKQVRSRHTCRHPAHQRLRTCALHTTTLSGCTLMPTLCCTHHSPLPCVSVVTFWKLLFHALFSHVRRWYLDACTCIPAREGIRRLAHACQRAFAGLHMHGRGHLQACTAVHDA
jgi:DEAD_2